MTEYRCVIGPNGSQTLVALTSDEIDQRNADAAAAAAGAATEVADVNRMATFENAGAPDLFALLVEGNSTDLDAWIDSTVTNMAGTRTALAALVRMVSILRSKLNVDIVSSPDV